MAECQYIRGVCDHHECAAWPYDVPAWPKQQPFGPTEADLCEGGGHAYYGDDQGRGRCYCGVRIYPAGGPAQTEHFDESAPTRG